MINPYTCGVETSSLEMTKERISLKFSDVNKNESFSFSTYPPFPSIIPLFWIAMSSRLVSLKLSLSIKVVFWVPASNLPGRTVWRNLDVAVWSSEYLCRGIIKYLTRTTFHQPIHDGERLIERKRDNNIVINSLDYIKLQCSG